MKTGLVLTVLAALAASASYGALGDVLASWEAPSPRHNFNGLAFEGEYIWVKNENSYEGWVFKCTTTGSVVTEIALPYPAPLFYSYGLAFDGEYLWTVYDYWHVPYSDDYRRYTTTGSYVGGFGGYGINWGSKAVAWDGEYILSESLDHKIAEKYTTAGTLVATFPMPVAIYSDMAYYKRQLWYSNGGLVYGVQLNGSVVASFAAPGGSCAAVGFDGEYLWTADKNTPQYIYKVDIDVVDVEPDSFGKIKGIYR